MAAEDELIENYTFDELPPGRRTQAQRALADADIEALALVSGDAAHTTLAGAWLGSVVLGQFPGPGTVCLEQTLHYERAVQAGDVMVADHDGVVAVPEAAWGDVLRLAAEKGAGEDAVRAALRGGASLRSVFDRHRVL